MNVIMCGAESGRRPAEEGQQSWCFKRRLPWRNRKSDFDGLELRHGNPNRRHEGGHFIQLTDRTSGRIVVFPGRFGFPRMAVRFTIKRMVVRAAPMKCASRRAGVGTGQLPFVHGRDKQRSRHKQKQSPNGL